MGSGERVYLSLTQEHSSNRFFKNVFCVVRLRKQTSLQCLQCSMCPKWTYENTTGGSCLNDPSSWSFIDHDTSRVGF